MDAETTQQLTGGEIFSFTFQFRKEVVNLSKILETVQEMVNSVYSCLITFANDNPRCIEFRIYEKNSHHPTITFSRLLSSKSSPSEEELRAAHKVNFALAHHAKIKFECNDDTSSVTIRIIEPKKVADKNSIIKNFAIIDILIPDKTNTALKQCLSENMRLV